ncbi:probable xyloglucan endotransglucosylase/hydrolase protein 21 isoform X2 [Helianthus annuus]|uniref:probable xyloglucan endotransglucosylase/hydrolase protein 21 isoform X2 n=1 Tax=Helianthus annuus TaxID=4232 RepID=UPI000B907D5E|nr:probable xyloglucan endotransglucosylase/hydrolase protein 21 isoform X2 [Helianthus annuus]
MFPASLIFYKQVYMLTVLITEKIEFTCGLIPQRISIHILSYGIFIKLCSAFASNDMFLFGQIDMPIKLVPGHSAGTVLAFYLTSDQPNRDEIDFQFLGNVSGQPYILQTSLYADDFDNREEIIYLWFDPTKDFHTYSILWNLHQIVNITYNILSFQSVTYVLGLNHVRTLKGHEHKNGRFFQAQTGYGILRDASARSQSEE